VLKLLKALVRPAESERADAVLPAPPPPVVVPAPGVEPFDLGSALADANGFPVVDWPSVQKWVASVPAAPARAEAWQACERGWLEHLRHALGPDYRLRMEGKAILLSTLEPRVAGATLAFVDKTTQRILRLLDGVADVPEWGYDIMIVFDDEDAYYRYVSHYYPEAGEFAASSGMFIHGGCGHFVMVKADLRAIEPVIAHELTHACLSHLPIPAWLNEGLAVNTEARLCPAAHGPADPQRTHALHRQFWGPEEIQQFWSGKSFLRNDDGNALSYDLARILVSQFGADWDRFRTFALAANLADGGASAAREHLGIDLGAAACAVLERDDARAWAPMPQTWGGEPERGAFAPSA
jgi:hypothetical protein